MTNKKAQEKGVTLSLTNVIGASFAAGLILVLLMWTVSFAGTSTIDRPTELGFKALVYSMSQGIVEDDIVIMNLGDYYVGQGADCQKKCICLYEEDNDQVAKECFSKKVNITAENKEIKGTFKDTATMLIRQSDDVIFVMDSTYFNTASLDIGEARCCVCQQQQAFPDPTCPVKCKWADISSQECSQSPGYRTYGVLRKECCENLPISS